MGTYAPQTNIYDPVTNYAGTSDLTKIGQSVIGASSAQTADSASQWSEQSSSWNQSDSWAQAAAEAYSDWGGSSDAWGDSFGYGGSQGQSENWSRTYGSEATAKDIELTKEQNLLQKSLWNEAADYNANQALQQMAFQERMSNTAYQRAVKDLLAAGLNPILAVGNMGASTPVGAMGAMSSANAYRANVIADQASYGSSSSSSYNRSGSHNESHSWNEGHSGSWSESSSGSHSEGGSQSSGGGTSSSHSEPTYVKAIEAAGNVISDLTGSAKDIIDDTLFTYGKDKTETHSDWKHRQDGNLLEGAKKYYSEKKQSQK